MIRTTDAAYIKAVMTHDAIWPFVSDDGSPAPDEWEPPLGEHTHWMRSDDGMALFFTHPRTRWMWELHIAVLPQARDKTTGYVREFAAYMRENTQASCLIGFIAEDNAPCLRAARAGGFKVTGVAPKSVRRSGRHFDMTIVTLEL